LNYGLYQTKAGAAMNKNPISLAFLLLLAGCVGGAEQPPLSDAPLAGASIGGPFVLTDQDGKRRSDAEFAGQYRLIYFGYTKCPDICTPDMQHLMAGLKRFEADNPTLGGKIQPIFISVDTVNETSDQLKQFTAAFHPRLIGLRGSEQEIGPVAKAFAIPYARNADGITMSHYQMPYLMGPKGEPLATLPADLPNTDVNEGAPEAVAAQLAKWVR
jgi:protein SCO1